MTPEEFDTLKARAEALIGRPVDMVPTTDGGWVVLYLNAQRATAPTKPTPEEALQAFVEQFEKDASHADSRDKPTGLDTQEDQGT